MNPGKEYMARANLQATKKIIAKNYLEINDENNKGWRNKAGTGDRKCPCGSWKNHWENFNGFNFKFEDEGGRICSEENCSEFATEGAHVFQENNDSRKEFIVPLCDTHNNPANTKPFNLKILKTVLVSANKGETCES
jgi:hypothetical protein